MVWQGHSQESRYCMLSVLHVKLGVALGRDKALTDSPVAAVVEGKRELLAALFQRRQPIMLLYM